MAHPDKAQIINLVNDLFSRSALTIDQIVGRMQARGCNITRSTFENQFTTRVERKPNIPSDWTLALVAAFTQRLTDRERCTAAEAIELARLAQLPIDQFKTLAQFFPPDEFDAAYAPYDPRSSGLPSETPPKTSLNRSAPQDSSEQVHDVERNGPAAGASAGKMKIGRRRRSVILGLSVGILLLLGLAWLALNQRHQLAAERQATRSRQLAAQALDHLSDRLDLALLLSTAAYQIANTYEARNSLLTALQTSPHLQTYLRGHSDWVWSVAFSPDGQTLASGSADGMVYVWDATTGQPLSPPLKGHTGWVRSVVFSPNGKFLLSAGDDKKIVLWDVMSPEAGPVGYQYRRPPLTGHTAFITALAFSPDGDTLASSSADGTVRLWDMSAALNSEAGAGQPLGPPLTGHTDFVLDVAFSPDGRTLASAGADESIILWDVSTLVDKQMLATKGQSGGAPGASEERLKQPLAYALPGHEGAVSSVAFSPDGQTLASGSADQTIRLWNVTNHQPRGQPLTGHSGGVIHVTFSPDGQSLISAGDDKTVTWWDATTGQPLDRPFIGHGDRVLSLALSSDGHTLASGSADGTVIMWNLSAETPLSQRLTGHSEAVMAMAFSPDGQTLASGGFDFKVRLWDVTTLEPLGPPLTGHSGLVTDVAFNPDGDILATSGGDRRLLLWDVTAHQLLGALLADHTAPLRNLAFHPGGQILALSDENKVIALWDVTTRQPLDSDLPVKGKPVVLSPAGQTLATTNNAEVILWDISTALDTGISTALDTSVAGGQTPQPPLKGHVEEVRSLAFSPDGHILASGSHDNTIILWDVSARQPMGQPLIDHADPVNSLAFSLDGRLLASGSEDGAIILWDLSTALEAGLALPQPLGRPLANGGRVWRVAFSPDGRRLASAGRNDGTILLWDVDPASWQERACRIVRRNLTLAEWQRYLGDAPYRLTCPAAPPPDPELKFAVPTPVSTPTLPALASNRSSKVAAPVIVEAFDSDRGFIQTSDSVYIENGQVVWHFKRNGGVQFVYRPIPPFTGNVRLTARGQVDSWTNNCEVRAGIGEGPGLGLSLNFGWTGGGCPTRGVLIGAGGVTLDRHEPEACVRTGTWHWLEGGTPYTAELTVVAGAVTLAIEGVGSVSGKAEYEGPYTSLWVGNTGRGDWPECTGKIDAVIVEALE